MGFRIFKFVCLMGLILPVCLSWSGNIWIKIATLSPEGSLWMEKMRQGAETIEAETQKRVRFKFYPSGRMGTDKMVLKKIKVGQLHGGVFVSGSLARFFAANQIYNQPLKFKTLEEVDYVRQHFDASILEGLEDAGFVTFGIIGGGFAYIMSKNPIHTVEDLQHQKVWIPDNDETSLDAIRAFGVSPIPLPLSDVRVSLQSGLVDTVGVSPMGALVLQWHTQIHYLTHIPLIYTHGALAISQKVFKKMSESDQELVRQVMGRISAEIQAESRLQDARNMDILKERGITFIQPDQQALKEWYRRADLASEEMVKDGLLPEDAVKQVDNLIKTFRKNRADQASAPDAQ